MLLCKSIPEYFCSTVPEVADLSISEARIRIHQAFQLALWLSNGSPLQCSCLENPMDGGAWWAAVHGVAKSRTRAQLSDFTFMPWRRKWQPTPWRIPGTGEPGGLPSTGSHRLGHNWSDLAAAWLSRERQVSIEFKCSIFNPLATAK